MRNHGLPTQQVAVYEEGEIVGSGSVVIDGCSLACLICVPARTIEDEA